jgi:hypothetical protein
LVIKGTVTGGDTIDIAIGDIMTAVDIPIDENGRFIKKITLDVETMVIVIKAYVNGPKDRDGNPVEVIFDHGHCTRIRLCGYCNYRSKRELWGWNRWWLWDYSLLLSRF